MKVLLVEDNQKIAELIQKGFAEKQHHVDIAPNGGLGKQWVIQGRYDAIILDIMIPGVDGIALCKYIRTFNATIPILMLTALVASADIVKGLDAGADDYLAKPFHFDELLARVNALCRRSNIVTPEMMYKVANLELDVYKKVARRAGKEVLLTSREFALLEFLIIHKNEEIGRAHV